MSYATTTSVPVERSRAEIEKLLQRFGAGRFMSGWDDSTAFICFTMGKLGIRFELPLPDRSDPEFASTPGGRRRRDADAQHRAWEQACRARWRALLLVIKAKLEAVEVGISTVEREFLAWTVIPGTGRTVFDDVGPKLLAAAESGKTPRLLLEGGA
jgi:hypothetical protein